MEDGKIPQWAARHFRGMSLSALERAIEDVERSTRAEIVPLVVRSVLPLRHLSWWLFLTVFLWGGLCLWMVVDMVGWVTPGQIMIEVSALVAICAVVAAKWGRSPFVIRFFYHRSDEEAFARQRAEVEFYRQRMQSTRHKSGVLFFVTLAERQSVVLLDPELQKQLPEDLVEGCLADILRGAREKDLAKGFVEALRRAEPGLKAHFASDLSISDHNELGNHLRFAE